MSAEVEAVKHLDDTILVWVLAKDSHENLGLDASIISFLFLVLTNLYGNTLAAVFHVNALDNLAKGTRVNDFLNNVAIGNLLTDFRDVEAVVLGDLANVLDANAAHSVDEAIGLHLGLFERRQLVFVLVEGLLRREALQYLCARLHIVCAGHVGAGVRLVIGRHRFPRGLLVALTDAYIGR